MERCLANVVCANIDQCIVNCGAGPTCIETCKAQNFAGIEDYEAATSCLYCTACRKSCVPEAVANCPKTGQGGGNGL